MKAAALFGLFASTALVTTALAQAPAAPVAAGAPANLCQELVTFVRAPAPAVAAAA
ncbi:MAG: hypothetical protein JWR08_2333, partial [Enterovirga sp.]|nr:hypothetical protein [Enterovirga sp.]